MSKAKFEKGKNINSLDELYKQDLIYLREKIVAKGFFRNWNIKFCYDNLNQIYYALEKINKKGR